MRLVSDVVAKLALKAEQSRQPQKFGGEVFPKCPNLNSLGKGEK